MNKSGATLVILLLCCFNLQASSTDSLKHALVSAKSPAQRAEIYNELSLSYIYQDLPQAYVYATEALNHARQQSSKEILGKTLFQYSLVLAEQQKFDSVIQFQEEVRSYLEGTGNELFIAKSLNETGIAYEHLANYKLSVIYYFKSLRLFEQLGEMKGVANEYINIGLIFFYQKQLQKADNYYKKAIALSKSIGYDDGEISALNNWTMSLIEQKQLNQALANYQYILEYDLKHGNKRFIGSSYNNLGEVYIKLERIDEALKNFHISERYKLETEDYLGLISCYNNMAEAYSTKKQYAIAKQYLEKALDMAIKNRFTNRLQDCYESHYEFYLEKKDYQSALSFYQKYVAISDTIRKRETDIELSRMLEKYDLEKVNKELGIQQELLKKETQLNKVYLVSGFLFLITTFILFFSLISVRRFNKSLTSQSGRIAKQNELLTTKNKELDRARQIAEEATKAKSQFLSMMSHEIRTPLNAIIGIVNVMAEDKSDVNNDRALMLKKSSEHLLSLVNDVLDLNKLEAGKVELENINFELKRIVFDLKEMFEGAVKEKGLTFHIDYDSRIPEKLTGDPVRLNQVLTNLVSNAIKFTHHGGISVNCRLQQRTEQKSRILFQVLDTGIGIPLNKQEEIFNSFTQADSATTRKYGGSGLGLSISRRILQLLKSDLQLSSKTGQGSDFYFTIEFYEAGLNEKKEPQNMQALLEKIKGMNVLVAEDNPMNVYVMKQFMQKWGVQVDIAENGLEVLKKLGEQQFDLVLMDIHMPMMDGMEATRKIRQDMQFQSLPIIAITATAEDEVRKEILQAGMNDYLMKPFKPDELIEKMSHYKQ